MQPNNSLIPPKPSALPPINPSPFGQPPSGSPPFGEPSLLTEPNHVPAGMGMTWIKQAWALMKQNLGIFLGAYWAFVVLLMLAWLIPFVNIISSFLGVFCTAGLCYMVHQQALGRPVTFEQLFIGFKHHAGNLIVMQLLMGVFYFVALIPAILLITLGGLTGALTESTLDADTMGLGMVLLLSLAFLYLLVVLTALVGVAWLAPALIVLHNMDALSALKLSWRAFKNNVGAFMVLWLVCSLLILIGALTLGLAYIVLFPLLAIMIYTSYRSLLTDLPLPNA